MKEMRHLLTLFCMLLLVTALRAQTNPNEIPGLQLWLDASDPNGDGSTPANGATVTSWADKSGFNRHASNHTAGSGFTRPVYRSNEINGKGVIRFARTSGTIGAGFSAPLDIRAMTNPDITIFTVYRQGTQSGDQAVWGCDNGGFDRFFFSSRTAGSSGSVSFGNVSPYLVAVANAGELNVVKCLTAVYSRNGGANNSAIYLSGELVAPFTDYTTTGTDALNAIRIGLDGDDNFYNGDMAEMIVYNRKLTACEIAQVNRYLNIKYGVSFSAVNISAGGATTFQEGGSVTLNTTAPATSRQWLRDNVAISGATGTSYVATETGSYRVAANTGCLDTSAAINVTATIPSQPNNALALDGVNDYIDLGTGIPVNNIRTLECWVKFNNFTDNQEIINKSSVGRGIELLVYNNRLAFFCMNGSDVSYINHMTDNMVTGRWYHVVATWNGTDRTTMRLYVDGTSVGTRTDAGNINATGLAEPTAPTKLLVGDWNDFTRPFNGTIDEVRIWNTVRTEAEVRAAAYDTLPRNTAGLLVYLRMDHGTSGGTNTGFTTVKNYVAGGPTATLVNMARTGTVSNFVESYGMVAPMPVIATGIYSTGFVANWTAPVVGEVNNYLLDVSTDPGFGSFVSGYNARNVGNVTSFTVTGLTLGVNYHYRLRANKTTLANQGANTYAYTSVRTAAALPAKWAEFTATAQGANVLLKWATLSEFNTSHFIVERSNDGRQFIALGRVEAAGEATDKQFYQYTDASAVAGVNHYRIRLIDKDGTSTYSDIRTVQLRDDSRILVYPVPARDHLFIEWKDQSAGAKEGRIISMNGQVVMRFRMNSNREKINIATIQAGSYLVQLDNGVTARFDKQ